MLRFFLFMAAVMVASTSTAGDASSCPVDTVPIEIMAESSAGIVRSADKIRDDRPHFRAFVTAVTEHVATRLNRDKLCIKVAGGMKGLERLDSMRRAAFDERSLLQFVHWRYAMGDAFNVPVLPIMGGVHNDCRVASPWINLVLIRKPAPQIRGIVRWNERQLLADQAVLAGARNVPPGVAMPLTAVGFLGRYAEMEGRPEALRRPAAKPIEERIPPDLLWLYRRSAAGGEFFPDLNDLPPFSSSVDLAMREATEKGAEGYTKLVISLIDRCFDADEAKGATLVYASILDVADPVLLEQYRIDMPVYRDR
ncbi:MAG: hypothetical protein LBS49_14810 [Candidatus Accumulibacter sp.]|nr:hypothetical protein [Accumulibacter sp.]